MYVKSLLIQSLITFGLLFGFSTNLFADNASDAQVDMICLARYACAKYARSANECASAGNFETCMKVKQNGEWTSEKCDYQGNPRYDKMKYLDRKLIDISDTTCWMDYIEIELARYGYTPSFFKRLERWIKLDGAIE